MVPIKLKGYKNMSDYVNLHCQKEQFDVLIQQIYSISNDEFQKSLMQEKLQNLKKAQKELEQKISDLN